MKKLIFAAAFLMSSAITYAGGYRVSTQGHRALAMGHAGVAVVNSAELAFFNPAGLVYLENKLNVSAGVFGVVSNVKWQNELTGNYAQTDNPLSTPLYLYASYKVNDWFTAGIAVYTPYGSSVVWPKDWAGSHLVNEISLQAIYIQPLASFKISDMLSVGGGPIFVTGSVNFNRNANRYLTNKQGERSNIEIDASGVTNWGWSASLMFNPMENLRIGVNYRSEINMEVEDGTATFSNVPNSPLVPISNGNVAFSASLPLPAELSVGFSYKFADDFLFAFDFNRTYWDAYKNLDIDFANTTKNPDSHNPRNYKNANTYRFGLQYKVRDGLTLRAGYYYDQTPVQEGYFAPETPRNDSNGYTAGLSVVLTSHLTIDASFDYVHFKEIDASYDYYYTQNGTQAPFSGTYKSNAFVFGVGLTYKL